MLIWKHLFFIELKPAIGMSLAEGLAIFLNQESLGG
jgi:hypothetical protein